MFPLLPVCRLLPMRPPRFSHDRQARFSRFCDLYKVLRRHPAGNSPRSRLPPFLCRSDCTRADPAREAGPASPKGRFAGNSWRPGCLQDPLIERRTGAHSHSPSRVTSTTMGPRSINSICTWESLSPPAPYLSTRIKRSCSSSTRIFSSAYCSRLFSRAISSTSAGAEGMTFAAVFETAMDVESGFGHCPAGQCRNTGRT